MPTSGARRHTQFSHVRIQTFYENSVIFQTKKSQTYILISFRLHTFLNLQCVVSVVHIIKTIPIPQ